MPDFLNGPFTLYSLETVHGSWSHLFAPQEQASRLRWKSQESSWSANKCVSADSPCTADPFILLGYVCPAATMSVCYLVDFYKKRSWVRSNMHAA